MASVLNSGALHPLTPEMIREVAKMLREEPASPRPYTHLVSAKAWNLRMEQPKSPCCNAEWLPSDPTFYCERCLEPIAAKS